MKLKHMLLAACAAAIPFLAPGEAKAGYNGDCHYVTKTVRDGKNVRSFATKICYGGWGISYYDGRSIAKHKPHVKRKPHFVRHDVKRRDHSRHYGHDRRGHRHGYSRHQHGGHCGHW